MCKLDCTAVYWNRQISMNFTRAVGAVTFVLTFFFFCYAIINIELYVQAILCVPHFVFSFLFHQTQSVYWLHAKEHINIQFQWMCELKVARYRAHAIEDFDRIESAPNKE